MAWHIVYDQATGRPVSETARQPDADALGRRGLSVAVLADRPTKGQMWDPATRAVVARPPKVIRDRLAEFQADSRWQTFTAQQKTRILAMLADFFDDVRSR